MRLSAKAQYACIAMMELGRSAPESPLVQVKTIADTHGIPQPFLVQILLQLKVHGLVQSIRGAAGGYQLARRAEAIALAVIINAIEQPPPSAPALASLKASPTVQAVGSVLQELEAKEQQMLAEISLADLLRRAEPAGMPTYQI